MNCNELFNLPEKPLREQIADMSTDEMIALSALQKTPVLLASIAPVGRTALFEMHCKGWLFRAEFADGDAVYKLKPEVLIEFEQYLRQQKWA